MAFVPGEWTHGICVKVTCCRAAGWRASLFVSEVVELLQRRSFAYNFNLLVLYLTQEITRLGVYTVEIVRCALISVQFQEEYSMQCKLASNVTLATKSQTSIRILFNSQVQHVSYTKTQLLFEFSFKTLNQNMIE